MDNIEKEYYKNISDCFHDNLVHPILGKDYYNEYMGLQCSRQTILDLKNEFDKQQKKLNRYRVLFYICLTVIMYIIPLYFAYK